MHYLIYLYVFVFKLKINVTLNLIVKFQRDFYIQVYNSLSKYLLIIYITFIAYKGRRRL